MEYSAPLTKPPKPPARPFRWLKRLVIGCACTFAGLLLFIVVARFIVLQVARSKRAAVIARLDRDDPGWRLEQIEAARRVYPTTENSATPLIAAGRPIPTNWPKISAAKLPNVPVAQGADQANLIGLLIDGDPLIPPDERQFAAIQIELDALEDSLIEARKVADMPGGRYVLKWAVDPFSTLLPDAQVARKTARLLYLDAILRVDEEDVDGALASCQAALNVGRSIGDEPLFISQLVRIDIETVSLRAIEHVLARGEPSEKALARLQDLLENEEAQPLLKIAARGERTLCSDFYSRLASRELTIVNGEEFMPPVIHWLYGEAMVTYAQKVVLEEMSEAISIADAPLSQQEGLADLWDQNVTQRASFDLLEKSSRLLLPAVPMSVKAYVNSRTRLRTAIVAVAAERYRQKNGLWPDSIEELTPWPLSHTLSDPHSDEPLLWSRSEEILIIYSPGPDRVDNGGTLEQQPDESGELPGKPAPKKPYWQDKDIGFRLKEASARRQLP